MVEYQSVAKAEAGLPERIPTVYTFHVEQLRLFAYISFWGMCLFAIIVSTFTVTPYLGPCPLNEGDEPTYGMHCSVLMGAFGFNNICTFWDYSPAKELTAMVYPIFEYSLIAYIIVEYLQIKNDYDNNRVPEFIKTTSYRLLWIKVVLVAWFRMIFVCSVMATPIPIFGMELQPVVAHTMGFFGMQFALILIAFENVVYIFLKGNTMFGMSVETTKKMARAYLIALLLVTCLKISWATSIFVTGTPWITGAWPHLFDRLWMLLAAFMPLLFSSYAIKHEKPMTISVVNYED